MASYGVMLDRDALRELQVMLDVYERALLIANDRPQDSTPLSPNLAHSLRQVAAIRDAYVHCLRLAEDDYASRMSWLAVDTRGPLA